MSTDCPVAAAPDPVADESVSSPEAVDRLTPVMHRLGPADSKKLLKASRRRRLVRGAAGRHREALQTYLRLGDVSLAVACDYCCCADTGRASPFLQVHA